MQRIAIVGAAGSGKTTLGEQLSARLGIPHVDLDALHWEANWQMVEREEFRRRVSAALSGEVWSAGGNYSKARDITWGRADTLVWLDYPLPLVFWRLFRRTLRRVITQEELWNGNRETLRGAFLSRDSLFMWLLQSYPRQKRAYPQLVQQAEYTHLDFVRLRSPTETREWVEALRREGSTPGKI